MSTAAQVGSSSAAPEIAATLAARRFGLFGFDAAETARICSVLGQAKAVASRFEEVWLSEPAHLGDIFLIKLDGVSRRGLQAAARASSPVLVIAPVDAILHGQAAAYGWAADFLGEPWSDAELLVRLFRLLAPARKSAARPEPRLQPLVLLADDDPAWVSLAEAVLQNHGMLCSAAGDGFEALRLARQLRPDLLVLDLSMPGIEGLQVLETIRQDPRLDSLPVALLTGCDQSAEVQRACELGAADYLLKPLSPTVLLNRVRRILAAVPAAEERHEPEPAARGE